MRIIYQPSSATPGDWLEMDASQWAGLADSVQPNRVCVQGVEFTAEHYHVEALEHGACRVVVSYDGDEYPPDEWYAREVTFLPLGPDEDPRFNERINTRQFHRIFAAPTMVAKLEAIGPVQHQAWFPWEAFEPPPARDVRHGVSMPDPLYQAHEASRITRGWREWTEGLDPEELDSRGRLRQQRPWGRYLKPKGTRTYFSRDTNNVSGVHALASTNDENLFSTVAGAGETEAGPNTGGGASNLAMMWTTGPNEPNSGAWPTGDYAFHIDVFSAGVDLTYGLRAAGSATGHFARVDSGLTADQETKAMVESLFSSTGVKDASTGSVSWTAGAAGDVFECLIAETRPANMGNQSLTFEFDSDGFAAGPWPAAVGAPEFMAAINGGMNSEVAVSRAVEIVSSGPGKGGVL